MFRYINQINKEVDAFSLLIMDRASSHTSKEVINYIEGKKISKDKQKFKVILLPAKTAFLISPCDKSFFSALKQSFVKMRVDTLAMKRSAAMSAYYSVSTGVVRNYFRWCGIISEEPFQAITHRLRSEVEGEFTEVQLDALNFFKNWQTGAYRNAAWPSLRNRRSVGIYFLNESMLDGSKWNI